MAKTTHAAHLSSEISKVLSTFAATLPTAIKEKRAQNPLAPENCNVSIELGRAHKKDIRNSDGFKLVKEFCKANGYRFSISAYRPGGMNEYTYELESPARVNVNPGAPYKEAKNLLQRFFLGQ